MTDLESVLAWCRRHLPDPVTGGTGWVLWHTRPDAWLLTAGGCVAKVAATRPAADRIPVGVDAALAAHTAGLPALPPLLDHALRTPVGVLSLWPRVRTARDRTPQDLTSVADLAALLTGLPHTAAERTGPAPHLPPVPVPSLPDPDLAAHAAAVHTHLTDRVRALPGSADRAPGPQRYCASHGDLHLGNVLTAGTGTWVVDWDTGGYWPYGWDVAAVAAGLLLAPTDGVQAYTRLLDAGVPPPPQLLAYRLLLHVADALPRGDVEAGHRLLDAALVGVSAAHP